MKKFNNWTLLLYFGVSLVSMEIVFRIATVGGGLFRIGVAISLFFALAVALLFFMVCTIFKPALSHILASFLLWLMASVFASQLVYHDIFTTFYTVYSAARGTQVLEFWREAVAGIFANPISISLLYMPCVLMLFLGRKYLSFPSLRWPFRSILAGCIVLVYASGVAVVHAGGRGQASAYALYYDKSIPVQSVAKLGLITTMRLDVQRLLSGWAPTIDAPPPEDTPVWDPDLPQEEEPVEYNVLNIDFSAMVGAEKDDTLRDLHRYFAGTKPSAKNEYTGKYQGYNLILITAEGFSHMAVREDVTPTLYKMAQEGYKFTDFYTPLWGVSTSDGEYVACTGLIPKAGIWSFKRSADNYMPLVMGNQFQRLGYQTVAYHNHSYKYYGRNLSHPNMGYDYKGVGNGLNLKDAWPRSDLEMMEKTVSEFIGNHQFHAYYMTVSGHLNYSFAGNNMASKNRHLVKDLSYSEPVRAYLATQIEFDRAMEYLLQQLEAAGIADKTLIAISADHYPYGLEQEAIEELSGEAVDDNFDLYRNAFLLWTKGMEPVTIDEPCSSLDIIPTISNLMGLEYDSRLLMGRDIHSDTKPLVIFADGSFITEQGRFNAANGKFQPNPGVSVEEAYVEEISAVVARKFYLSAMILDTDYYAKVMPSR